MTWHEHDPHASERPTIIGTRVIMGGTSRQDLLDAYRAAMDALDAAVLWRIAMNLHDARLAQLKRMKADFEAIAGYVVAQSASPERRASIRDT